MGAGVKGGSHTLVKDEQARDFGEPQTTKRI